MVAYGAAKAWPSLNDLPSLLSKGWLAWLAAAPVALLVVPFLLVYAAICASSVGCCWRDAVARDVVTSDGIATLVASDRYAYTSGRSVICGTANRLSVGGRMFTSVPERVLRQISVDDRVRVTYTPRVQYVVAIALIED